MAQVFKQLPRKARLKHDDFDAPPLLKVELQTHRAQLRKEYEVKRLDNEKAFGERLVMDYFHKPSPQVSAKSHRHHRMIGAVQAGESTCVEETQEMFTNYTRSSR